MSVTKGKGLTNSSTKAVDRLESGSRVVIYGAGGFGKWISELCEGAGLSVAAVIDQAPGAADWCRVIGLEDELEEIADLPVLLGVFSPQPDIVAIEASLRARGYSSVLTPPQFFGWLGQQGRIAQRYWLSSDPLDQGTAEGLAEARELLADEESREVFDGIVAYRRGGGTETCPRPRHLSEQHTGIDFGFLPQVPGVVVDCGAYIGDTFSNWESAKLVHAEVLALEPDSTTFPEMVLAARESSLKVIPLPMGVAERTASYRVEGQGASARLVEDPLGQVEAVSLDDLLAGTRASFIKMDIEGGEAAALRGAREVLQRDRPHLAISIYHTPADLWEIITWLDRNVGGYEFRLRVYGHQGYDTVLYARIV